ncbi:MAG TPA: right-handed parallel beta-helix repeat-containing protein [Candidatus Acidoferrum sp.]|nr:right-handed parallel beta-helix repeat-containing protein [Candidatus Acidoferrum sp.]
MRDNYSTDGKVSRRQAIGWLLSLGALSIGTSIQAPIRLLLNETQERTTRSVPSRFQRTPSPGEIQTTQTANTCVTNDASKIIADALADGETKIYLPAGNYSVSNSIKVSQSNVEIYGDGPSTILRLNDNVLRDMLLFVSANNFHVHDLQLDGNRLNQPFTPPTTRYGGAVNISGIDAWNCSDGLIENCFIHDCRTFGVLYSQCTSCSIQDNHMQNCDANGVTIDNSTGGSGCVVRRNFVDGASDVGITGSDAVNYLVEKNTIKNVTMNTSPFEQNTNIGVACEGNSAGCINCSYVENTIENTLVGAYIGFVNGLNFKKNIINGIVATGNGFPGIPFAVNVDTKTTGVVVENNLVEGLPSVMQSPIVQLLSPTGGIFKNNMIFTNGGKLAIWSPSGTWQIFDNKLT